MARPGSEMRPRCRAADQGGSSVKNEKKTKTDSNEQQAGFTIFCQEGQPHGATMNRSTRQRKPNRRSGEMLIWHALALSVMLSAVKTVT